MYLPPKIGSVASSGFGGQIDASNNFGSSNNGYGEIGLGQDAYGKNPTADGSNYGAPAKNTEGQNSGQTSESYDISTSSGPGGSSFDQGTDYNTLSPGGNNFGQGSSTNNEYNHNSPDVTGNKNYGNSLGTTPNNGGIIPQRGNTDDYGQNELLTKNNFNGVTETNQIGQNAESNRQYDQDTNQNIANGYGNVASGESKDSRQDYNRNEGQNAYGRGNNGNFDSRENQQFSVNGGGDRGNAVPSWSDQKPKSGDYGQQVGFGNTPNAQFGAERNADNSYGQNSNGGGGGGAFSGTSPNFNDPSKTTGASQYNNGINNGNYGQNEQPRGGYNQGGTTSTSEYGPTSGGSNQGQSDFAKPNSDSYSPNSKGYNSPNSGFQQSQTSGYGQKPAGIDKNQIGNVSPINFQGADLGANGLRPGIGSVNSYGQSLSETNGYNVNSNPLNGNPSGPLQGTNNYEQSGPPARSFGSGENYGQNSAVDNDRGDSSSGFDRSKQSQQSSNYGQTGPQTNGENYNNRRDSTNGGQNRGGPSAGFDQSQPAATQTSNGYGQAQTPSSSQGNYGGQSSSGSIRPTNSGYDRGSPSNGQNGLPRGNNNRNNNYGPAASQTSSPTEIYERNNFNSNSGYAARGNSQNAEYYGGNDNNRGNTVTGQSRSSNYGQGTSTPERNGYTQIGTPQKAVDFGQNGLSATTTANAWNSGRGSSGSSSDYGRDKTPGVSHNNCENIGGSLSTIDAGSQTNSHYGTSNHKKNSTPVPKSQYQNSNLPSDSREQEKGSYGSTNNNNFGEPGLNAFSNFAPGNQPNPPTNLDDNNNCSTDNNVNKQTEAVFPSSNTGY